MSKEKKKERSILERFIGPIADKERPLVLRSLIVIGYIIAIGLSVGFATDNLSISDVCKWAMSVWSGLGM